jgi:NAD(P)-dependent dehydrogenase (short-subunit alcohol dehydrogenase family)
MSETILITGASGLLGRALVARFSGAGFQVLAQFRRRRGKTSNNVQWLAGDFSSPESTATFLKTHAGKLAACGHVIHNYGPIVQKDTATVTAADLLAAYQAQLQPALDITRFLLARAPLCSVLFIAFDDCGRVRAYRKILAYAMAKNALPLLSRSLAAVHSEVRFNVFSPPTLEGAEVVPPGEAAVASDKVAARIFQVMKYRRSGQHYRFAAYLRKKGRKRHG